MKTQKLGGLERLVARKRSIAEQAIISIVLIAGFTLLREVIDHGRLGVQFASCFPAILLASVLLDPLFTVIVAVGSVATVQWLLIGKQWFSPLDFEHVAVAAIFVLSLIIVVLTGRALRDSLQRVQALARQQALLNNVLREDMRSSISMLQAIVMSAKEDQTDTAFRSDVIARINALSSANSMLHTDARRLYRLPDSLDCMLSPLDRDGRFSLRGPACELDSQSAVALTMVAHRLANESVRNGALSRADGRLDITWSVRDDGALAVVWQETGPQYTDRSSEPALMMEMLPELTEVRFTDTADGLRCDFVIRPGRDEARAAA